MKPFDSRHLVTKNVRPESHRTAREQTFYLAGHQKWMNQSRQSTRHSQPATLSREVMRLLARTPLFPKTVRLKPAPSETSNRKQDGSHTALFKTKKADAPRLWPQRPSLSRTLPLTVSESLRPRFWQRRSVPNPSTPAILARSFTTILWLPKGLRCLMCCWWLASFAPSC